MGGGADGAAGQLQGGVVESQRGSVRQAGQMRDRDCLGGGCLPIRGRDVPPLRSGSAVLLPGLREGVAGSVRLAEIRSSGQEGQADQEPRH